MLKETYENSEGQTRTELTVGGLELREFIGQKIEAIQAHGGACAYELEMVSRHLRKTYLCPSVDAWFDHIDMAIDWMDRAWFIYAGEYKRITKEAIENFAERGISLED